MERHKATLADVDILISAVTGTAILRQKNVILAAKEAGVKRVIPCDFATPGAKGVRELHDQVRRYHQLTVLLAERDPLTPVYQKLGIREFIKEHGIPHTFIDVGWWMQIYLPIPLRSAAPPEFRALTYRIVGDGKTRILLTDNAHIGTFVARIVADPRTLNQAVIVWEDQASQLEAQEIGARVSGDGNKLKELYVHVSC